MERRIWLRRSLPLLILLVFWANGLAHLDVLPLVHEDEPWILSPGYTFWQEGRFGSDLFSGFYGMEDHFFGFLPLFSLLNGGLAGLIGLGLFQARFGALALMVLALSATYSLGCKCFSGRVGLVAILFLTFFRVAGPFPHLIMGIPFADAARIARYDTAVPIFALLAWLCFIEGIERAHHPAGQGSTRLKQIPFLFLLAGLLVGCASLSHIYGALWLPALALSHVWLSGRRAARSLLAMSFGFGLAWLPYLIFVLSAWFDFLGQNLANAARVEVTNPVFYLLNLLNEVERYDALFNGAKMYLGSWILLTALPLATLLLFYRATRQQDRSAKIILPPLLILVLGFALLLKPKTFTYLATLWPLFALTLATGLVYVWEIKPAPPWWRPAIGLILLFAILEGGWGMLQFHQQAARTTPYRTFTAQLADRLPAGKQILALQHYWFGLSDFAYRTMLVPFFLISPGYIRSPITFYQALSQSEAEVIIVDEIMQRYFDEISPADHPDHYIFLDFNQYLADHHAQVLSQFQDASYGRVTIYLLKTLPYPATRSRSSASP